MASLEVDSVPLSHARWEPCAFEELVSREDLALRKRRFWRKALPYAALSVFSFSLGVALPHVIPFGADGFVSLLMGIAFASLFAIGAVNSYQTHISIVTDLDHETLRGLGTGARSLVDLSVYVNDAKVGTDRCVVWCEEGRLCFMGHRTSFSLGGGVLKHSEPFFRSPMVGEVSDGVSIYLHPVSGKKVRLELSCVRDARNLIHSEKSDLRMLVQTWSRSSYPDDYGQFPPTTSGPGVVSVKSLRVRCRVMAAMSLVVLPLIGLGLVFAFSLTIAVVLLLSVLVWAALGLWAWKDKLQTELIAREKVDGLWSES